MLWGWRKTRIWTNCFCRPARISREPSVEPSSTHRSSISRPTDSTRSTTRCSVACSLYTGITTESFIARKVNLTERKKDHARFRMTRRAAYSVRFLPFFLQGGEKVGAAVGTQELVVLNHGGDADAGGGKRVLHANDASGKLDAYGVGEGYMRRKRQSDFELGPGGN